MEDSFPQTDQGSKPRRLRQKDLEELREKHQNGEDKLIPIWQRADTKAPLTPFVDAFSRTALATFSPVWKKKLDANPEFLVVDGKRLSVYKLILDWINLCIEEGNDVKFPDIEELQTDAEQRDDERPHQLHVLLEVIAAANFLQIPEGSLQNGLKKRAPGYARKHLIDLGFVERIYSGDDNDLTPDLREAAAISIFEGWWTFKLDQPEYDQYVSYLEQMRVDYPQLDEDLHEQFNKKKEYIEGKRQEKIRARAEASALSVDTGFDKLNGSSGGGWDSVDTAVDTGDGWNQAAAMMTTDGTGDWDKTAEETSSWAAPSVSMW